MSRMGRCEECGREVTSQAPDGLCPACLFALGAAEIGPESLGFPEAPGISAKKNASSVRACADTDVSRGWPAHRLGAYELLELIGRGGMGVVYKARQLSLGRTVALKLLPPGQLDQHDVLQRFRAEANAVASLQHPNIVTIHEVGEFLGQPYFSMDYVEGQTLAELVRQEPLLPARAAGYLQIIAAAVHYAHQHGILHRDLKPSNILIDFSDQPRVTDFGLAKRLDADTGITLTGQVLGSPSFISPEQAQGRREAVTIASDVYSLGGLLYYLLTCRPPFQADTLTTLLKQVCESEVVSPRLLNPAVPRDLETICLKCLEKQPGRRYASAESLGRELGRFLRGEPILAHPVGLPGTYWKWCRRKPMLAGLAAGLVLTFIFGLVGVSWQWRRAEALRQAAQRGEYAADMNNAATEIAAGKLRHAAAVLDRYRLGQGPGGGPRHWEWRYLWQFCQGDPCEIMDVGPGHIGAVASSRDGRVLVLQQAADVVACDLVARRITRRLARAATGPMAVSSDGTRLACAQVLPNGRPGIVLWDLGAGKRLTNLLATLNVRALAFAPDARLLATFEFNRTNGLVCIRELASGQLLLSVMTAPPRRTDAGVVTFTPDGKRLILGSDFGMVQVFDLETGTPRLLPATTVEGVVCLAVSPNSEVLAAGFAYASSIISLWDLRSGQTLGQLTNHTDCVNGLAFSADGTLLASSGEDDTVRIWLVANQTQAGFLKSPRSELYGVTFLSGRPTVVSASRQGGLRFWSYQQRSALPAHSVRRISYGAEAMTRVAAEGFAPGHLDPRVICRSGVAFAADTVSYIVPDQDGVLGVWNSGSHSNLERLEFLGTNNWGVALSADGHWLAVGEVAGRVAVWDWRVRKARASFAVPFECYGKLLFSAGGRYLIARILRQDMSQLYRVWRVADWAELPLGNINRGIRSADLSADDRRLIAGYSDHRVRIWSFPSSRLELVSAPHPTSVNAVAFAPNGRTAVSASTDGTVKLWDVRAGREIATLRQHLGLVWATGFSADGRRLLLGGNATKDALEIWDLAARKELLTLEGEGLHFVDVGFSPDGSIIQATSLDGQAHFWRAPSWAAIQAAAQPGTQP